MGESSCRRGATKSISINSEPYANKSFYLERYTINKRTVFEKADRVQFFTKCRYYEEGERNGKMLAMIAKSQTHSNNITSVRIILLLSPVNRRPFSYSRGYYILFLYLVRSPIKRTNLETFYLPWKYL